MNEIDDLLKISNRGHNLLSGAAKFWVVLAWSLSVGIPILVVIALIVAYLLNR